MDRTLTPELMDDPGVSRQELGRALRYIRTINRGLGGVSALLTHLKAWSHQWPRDRPISLLDVATGSADLPRAAVKWAQKQGFDLRVTCIDKHHETVGFARKHTEGIPAISVEQCDALALDARFPAGSFDYVHAGLFLHHLPESDILSVLRQMSGVAAKGLIWNDLVRSRVAHRVIRLLTLGQPHMIRHDAAVSVLAGFTQEEAESLAARAGIDYAPFRWSVITHRFTIAGEKPGCWAG